MTILQTSQYGINIKSNVTLAYSLSILMTFLLWRSRVTTTVDQRPSRIYLYWLAFSQVSELGSSSCALCSMLLYLLHLCGKSIESIWRQCGCIGLIVEWLVLRRSLSFKRVCLIFWYGMLCRPIRWSIKQTFTYGFKRNDLNNNEIFDADFQLIGDGVAIWMTHRVSLDHLVNGWVVACPFAIGIMK